MEPFINTTAEDGTITSKAPDTIVSGQAATQYYTGKVLNIWDDLADAEDNFTPMNGRTTSDIKFWQLREQAKIKAAEEDKELTKEKLTELPPEFNFDADVTDNHLVQFVSGGFYDAAENVMNTGLAIADFAATKLGLDYDGKDARFNFAEEIMPASSEPTVQFARSAGKFLQTFAASSYVAGGAGSFGSMKDLAVGAIADFMATDPKEEQLMDFLNENPQLVEGVSMAKAAGANADSELYRKATGAIEGALFGMSLKWVGDGLKRMANTLASVARNYGFRDGMQRLGRYNVGLTTKLEGVDLPPLPTEGKPITEAKKVAEILSGKAKIKKGEAFNYMNLSSKQKQEAYEALINANIDKIVKAKGQVEGFMGKVSADAQKYLDEVKKISKATNTPIKEVLSKRIGNPLSIMARNNALAQVTDNALGYLAKATDLVLEDKMGGPAYMKLADETFSLLPVMEEARTQAGQITKSLDYKAGDRLDFNKAVKEAEIKPKAAEEVAGTGTGTKGGSGSLVDRELRPTDSKEDALRYVQKYYGNNPKKFAKHFKAFVAEIEAKGPEGRGEALRQMSKWNMNWWDRILTWRMMQLLTGPMTQFKNITANTVATAAGLSDTFYEELFSRISGVGQAQAGDTINYAKGLVHGMNTVMATAKQNLDYIRKGESDKVIPIFDDVMRKTDMFEATEANTNPALGNTMKFLKYVASGRIGMDTMNITDQAFKQVNSMGAMYLQAGRLADNSGLTGVDKQAFIRQTLQNADKDLMSYGLDNARHLTFTSKRKGVYKSIEEVARHPKASPYTKLFIPFLGTLLNVAKETQRHTPVLGMLIDPIGAKGATAATRLQKKLAAQATGATMIATSMIALEMADAKVFGTLGYDDRARALKAQGHQDNSIVVGGNSYVYGTDSIAGKLLATFADIKNFYEHLYSAPHDTYSQDEIAERRSETMTKVMSIIGTYFNPTFITDFTGAISEAANRGSVEPLKHVITGLPSSFIPYSAAIRQLSKSDMKVMTSGPVGLNTWTEQAKAKLKATVDPTGAKGEAVLDAFSMISDVMSDEIAELYPEGLRPQLDILGNPDMNSKGMFSKKAITTNPVLKEIARLSDAERFMAPTEGDTRLVLQAPLKRGTYMSSRFGVRSYNITNMEEYFKLRAAVAGKDEDGNPIAGKTLEQQLKEVISSPEYKELSSKKFGRKAQIEIISGIFDKYKQLGMAHVFDNERQDIYRQELEIQMLKANDLIDSVLKVGE